MAMRFCAVLAFLLMGVGSSVMYLPGVSPRAFQENEKVDLSVNKLTSTKTQVPYGYYDFAYCQPSRISSGKENLGEVMAGDRKHSSPYVMNMKETKSCATLCKLNLSPEDLKDFREAIDDDYRVHWFVDNLPASIRIENEDNPNEPYYARGHPVGFKVRSPETNQDMHFLYNHVRIVIRYNENKELFSGSRIVGFEVVPFSFNHDYDREDDFDPETTVLSTCNAKTSALDMAVPPESVDKADEDVIFTYDVFWVESDTPWANRWDVYLRGNPNEQIHWFSIINSLMIVVFLTGMVAMIMLRTLHRDIAQYNEMTADDGEESGWKLVHGDVFRPPSFQPMVLASLAGTGVQIFAMVFVTMTFALLGFLSPANRGGLLTALLLIFVFMGSFSGYYSARLYKAFGGKDWKRSTICTALLYPATVFTIFFVVNATLWSEESSGAVAFGTLFALLVLWFGVSAPLVCLGSYFGFKKEKIEYPVRTNQIARQVPEQAWYMQPVFHVMVGGVLPFGAVCIELFFIMAAIWLHQVYYVFGFLFVVLIILILTCAEITIVLCYFQLCSEDFRWWWRSFLSSGAAAGYLFLYSIWYFMAKLEIDTFVSSVIYFGYMSIICLTFFLLTGCIGFFSCYWFVRKIYGSIKID